MKPDGSPVGIQIHRAGSIANREQQLISPDSNNDGKQLLNDYSRSNPIRYRTTFWRLLRMSVAFAFIVHFGPAGRVGTPDQMRLIYLHSPPPQSNTKLRMTCLSKQGRKSRCLLKDHQEEIVRLCGRFCYLVDRRKPTPYILYWTSLVSSPGQWPFVWFAYLPNCLLLWNRCLLFSFLLKWLPLV